MKKVVRDKAILFGCGYIYSLYKDLAHEVYEVIAIADNNQSIQGTIIDDYPVIAPSSIIMDEKIVIILMTDSANEIWNQLRKMGFPKKRVLHYKDLIGKHGDRMPKVFAPDKSDNDKIFEKVIIVSNALGFHGVSVVSLRAAKCLQSMGYKAVIAATNADERYISEANDAGITIILQQNLQNATYNNIRWIDEFDYIIVNSAVMIIVALEIAKKRNAMLWIHENVDNYDPLEFWKNDISNLLQKRNLLLYAVSERAASNFKNAFSFDGHIKSLPISIDDWKCSIHDPCNRLSFAVVGNLHKRKGQDVLLDALQNSSKILRELHYFWMIGRKTINEYGKTICKRSARFNNVFLLGERTQAEMKELYNYMDVILVPSREETFCLAAAEAMMMGKVCVVSDACGIADYIQNGVNGFVFKSEDTSSLLEIMEWCINNTDKFSRIGKNARKTYEDNFSTGRLKKNLEICLIDQNNKLE